MAAPGDLCHPVGPRDPDHPLYRLGLAEDSGTMSVVGWCFLDIAPVRDHPLGPGAGSGIVTVGGCCSLGIVRDRGNWAEAHYCVGDLVRPGCG